MALDLDASAVGAVPETEVPAEGGTTVAESADPKASAQTDAAPATTQATSAATAEAKPKTEPVDTEDRRARRAAESELARIKASLKELEAARDRLKPYADLEEIGRQDPARWISEIADAQGITPQRVMEMLTKRGAGEPAALTAEERVAKLERAWAEREAAWQKEREDNERRSQETRSQQILQSNIAATSDFIKANAAKFPGLDEKDGEAVFQVVQARYAQLGDEAPKTQGPELLALYMDAAERVEAAIRAEAERRAVRFGYSKPTTVAAPAAKEGFRGLSLSNTTAPAPPHDSDRVNTPDDMDALMRQMFS
jgi:hypothetical protein